MYMPVKWLTQETARLEVGNSVDYDKLRWPIWAQTALPEFKANTTSTLPAQCQTAVNHSVRHVHENARTELSALTVPGIAEDSM